MPAWRRLDCRSYFVMQRYDLLQSPGQQTPAMKAMGVHVTSSSSTSLGNDNESQPRTMPVANEQWGGRPGRTAIDLVMSKEMITTIHHIMRKNGAIIDADATACYNRIVPSLIWLAYWKAGATWKIVQLLACSLMALQYYN
eukprot:scaffold17533_cov70-Attheya_sp.AAC.1